MAGLQIVFKSDMDRYDGKVEDSFLYKNNLFILADGVGGEYIGETAKARAYQAIAKPFFAHLSEGHSPSEAIIFALKEANAEIIK